MLGHGERRWINCLGGIASGDPNPCNSLGFLIATAVTIGFFRLAGVLELLKTDGAAAVFVED